MIMELHDSDTDLKLDDLYLCGYLASRGIRPQALEVTDFGRKYFIYAGQFREELDELVDDFHYGAVEVSLPKLRSHIKDLKELMRRER